MKDKRDSFFAEEDKKLTNSKEYRVFLRKLLTG